MLTMESYHIGNTPLVELPPIGSNRILIKLEQYNFLGSIKARTGYWMIQSLPDGKYQTIIESTSGNLGFSLGYFCKETGRDFIALVDPSIAHVKLERLKEFGIRYLVVSKEKGYDYRSSRIRLAQRMMEKGDCYWINQYNNPDGVYVHEITTGLEIWKQTDGAVTDIVCPMGSCGTICGLGRFFRRMTPHVRIVGVEPYGSTIFGTDEGSYLNVGAGLMGKPGNLIQNPDTVDQAFTVEDHISIACAQKLKDQYGLSVGITSGMAYYQALQLAKTTDHAVIVIISPDGRESYGQYFS